MRSGLKLILLIYCALPLHAETPDNSAAASGRTQLATLSKPFGPSAAGTNLSAQANTPPENGEKLFAENCASCHGSGVKGVPDLASGISQYGNSDELLRASIANGRTGLMPSFGVPLGDNGLEQVLNYVLSFSGRGSADELNLQAGAQQFDMFCASCHGDNGTGTLTIGAPDLTDSYWLHGGNIDEIRSVIRDGRAANMPAHGERLSAENIDTLVEYTKSLSRNITLAEAPQ